MKFEIEKKQLLLEIEQQKA